MPSRATLFMVFSLVAAPLVLGPVAAQPTADPNPGALSWTDGRYGFGVSDDLAAVGLVGDVLVHEIAVAGSLALACGPSCSADEARDVFQRALPTQRAELVAALEGLVERRARLALQAIAGGSGEPEVEADLDETDLSQPRDDKPFHPALRINVQGSAPIGFFADTEYDASQLQALFAMGARVRFPVAESVAAGDNLTLTFAVPEPLGVLEASQGEVSPNGRTATWTVENWQGGSDAPLAGEPLIGRPDVIVPEREEADVEIVIDLSQVDVHYSKLLSGTSLASLDVVVSVEGAFRAIKVPVALPEALILPTLSADAVRIALEAGIVDRDQVTGLEREARSALGAFSADGFGERPTVEGGFVNETLAPGAAGDPPGSGGPILFNMAARTTLSVPPEEPVGDVVAAFTVARVPLGTEFELPEIAIPGAEGATITFILPPGVDLEFDSVQGGVIQRTETEDGRTAMTLERTGAPGEPATVQGATLVVGHPLVWQLFWPVIVFLFLVLVVLPALLIALVVRRRRKRRKTRAR